MSREEKLLYYISNRANKDGLRHTTDKRFAKTWYECDPEKNTKCSKTTCMFCKVGILNGCHLTTDERYKREGTVPKVIAVYTNAGDEVSFVVEPAYGYEEEE